MCRELQFRHRLYNVYPSIREVATFYYHHQPFVCWNGIYSSRAARHARSLVYRWIDLSLTGGCNEVKLAIRYHRACRHSNHVHVCMFSCHLSVRTVYIICGRLFAVIRNSPPTNASARTSTNARTRASADVRKRVKFLSASFWIFWILSDISSAGSSLAFLIFFLAVSLSVPLLLPWIFSTSASLSVNIPQWGELELFDMRRSMSLPLYGFVCELTSLDKQKKRVSRN